MMVRVAGIVRESVVDGPGIRFVIFAQGCKHNCEGCQNPETHDMMGGEMIEADELVEEIINNKHIDGVTFSGGDPFFQVEAFKYIAQRLKSRKINIIAYSGYKYEKIIDNEERFELLKNIDVLIDGAFLIDKRTYNKPFRGSSNQRVIDVNTSLFLDRIIELNI
jgi:anaerobic ribonucleoside-triphosphate reductase activating protein